MAPATRSSVRLNNTPLFPLSLAAISKRKKHACKKPVLVEHSDESNPVKDSAFDLVRPRICDTCFHMPTDFFYLFKNDQGSVECKCDGCVKAIPQIADFVHKYSDSLMRYRVPEQDTPPRRSYSCVECMSYVTGAAFVHDTPATQHMRNKTTLCEPCYQKKLVIALRKLKVADNEVRTEKENELVQSFVRDWKMDTQAGEQGTSLYLQNSNIASCWPPKECSTCTVRFLHDVMSAYIVPDQFSDQIRVRCHNCARNAPFKAKILLEGYSQDNGLKKLLEKPKDQRDEFVPLGVNLQPMNRAEEKQFLRGVLDLLVTEGIPTLFGRK